MNRELCEIENCQKTPLYICYMESDDYPRTVTKCLCREHKDKYKSIMIDYWTFKEWDRMK